MPRLSARGDANAYSTGMIGKHAVVLAASSASACALSFPEIRLALIVGICGGVPFMKQDKEILLGDVAISDDGLVPNQFLRKDSILDSPGKPGAEITAFLSKLKGYRSNRCLHDSTWTHLLKLQEYLGEPSFHPGVEDKLFEPNYRHKRQIPGTCEICLEKRIARYLVCETALTSTCEELHCDSGKLMSRKRFAAAASRDELTKGPGGLVHPRPMVHFGLIASGDRVMKSGEDCDIIAKRENIIAFEMEGVGGICNYADSHKSERWQGYAAATAAACTKALLEQWMGRGTRS
ncbi:nucleoside phosphorylase domain-containing protein [Cercophora scortea]|uniref:Nucleoside phosphorylase domain-containing protein n=1 Tax=Cercophora scortea TaxID=314031 RepID=A0AAE0J3N8_9PEZI|nr:nucleoside phosphorylase domain-containing protein [Cercophora scortea]